MDNRQHELSGYRLQEAEDSLKVAQNCLSDGFYKDSINRSYYAAFYAIKSVLALGTVDFKRHKDVIAYFNKEYVAKEIFPRELGRRLGTLKQVREKSANDFVKDNKISVWSRGNDYTSIISGITKDYRGRACASFRRQVHSKGFIYGRRFGCC